MPSARRPPAHLVSTCSCSDSEFDREKAEERIAKLGGAIGRIKVGAATETELKDKKLRYEDALNSVKVPSKALPPACVAADSWAALIAPRAI